MARADALSRVDLAGFVAEPKNRYFAGEHFLYACVGGRLFARILWGQPTLDDAHQILEASDVEHRAGPDLVGMFDAAAIRDVDWSGLGSLTTRLRERGVPARCTAHVLIAPPGELGQVLADVYLRFQTTVNRQVAATRQAGLAWLGCADAEAALAGAEAEVTDGGALLGRLRAALEATPLEADMDRLARSLGLSPRTLQRRLGDHGTSFRAELGRARARVAQRLLRETDRSITEIAYDVGCSSPQNFSRLFRSEVGSAPSDYRRDARLRQP